MPNTVRIAAAGDMHCRPAHREHAIKAFEGLDAKADVLLLAGDGNHDWHCNTVGECLPIWAGAGIEVLDRAHAVVEVAGLEVGVAGVKGFVGGFPGSHLPDFGEPSLRGIYAEAGEEAAALDRGLRAIANCPYRVALLHYSPSTETLEGEPREIWTMLGTDRLAAPIREHEPDLALHGHAHAGTFEGALGGVPVYNVSVPVMGRDFWVFELSAQRRPVAPIR